MRLSRRRWRHRTGPPRPCALTLGAVAIVTLASAVGASPRRASGEDATRHPPSRAAAERDSVAIGAAIAARLAAPRPAELRASEWAAVARAYRSTGGAEGSPAPFWLDDERLGSRARELASYLATVETRGLRPDDYPTRGLTDALGAASRARLPADAHVVARADVLLTASFVDVIVDLLTGRVDPRAVEPGWHIAQGTIDVDARVASALAAVRGGRSVRDVLDGLRPDFGGARELEAALARYRGFARGGGWPVLPGGPTLHPGDAGPRVTALRHRLAAEAYLPSASGSDTFDVKLAGAVAEFQRRHGLSVDSLVGPATRAALDVSAAYRRRQIEANLERLRWLPPDPGDRFVVVNVPSFTLVAFDSTQRVLGMRVVVGDELTSRRTPIFADTMQYVQFGPYWNVPRSIAVNEILPHARRDRAYLARNGYQIVRGWGDDAPVVDPYALSNAALFSTRYRVRQLPGPDNALGRVKFMFPNDYAVYLHDTPAKSLFDESHRAHSHGCVRVEDPAALAAFVLQRRDDWPRARIDATLASGRQVRVNLQRGVPVYLIYLTAFTRDGDVAFRDDIYQRDARLLEALGDDDG